MRGRSPSQLFDVSCSSNPPKTSISIVPRPLSSRFYLLSSFQFYRKNLGECFLCGNFVSLLFLCAVNLMDLFLLSLASYLSVRRWRFRIFVRIFSLFVSIHRNHTLLFRSDPSEIRLHTCFISRANQVAYFVICVDLGYASAVRVLTLRAVLMDVSYVSVNFDADEDSRIHSVGPALLPRRLSSQFSFSYNYFLHLLMLWQNPVLYHCSLIVRE